MKTPLGQPFITGSHSLPHLCDRIQLAAQLEHLPPHPATQLTDETWQKVWSDEIRTCAMASSWPRSLSTCCSAVRRADRSWFSSAVAC